MAGRPGALLGRKLRRVNERVDGYEPGGRKFESCWAHQSFQIRSGNRSLGLLSQPVTVLPRRSISAWQAAWQGVRVAERVASPGWIRPAAFGYEDGQAISTSSFFRD